MPRYADIDVLLEHLTASDEGNFRTTITQWLEMYQVEDVAPVIHAHWIEDHGDIVCSNCGARYSDEIVFMNRDKDVYDLPHCPTCSAKMDEVS